MARASCFHLFALKEKPAEAEIISHQLMLRAGLIAPETSGIYSWLPLGVRVLRKVEQIIREEMQAIGCNEVLLPGVQPADLWRESGRWNDYGAELLRFCDRHEREYCLGPTHEEIITDLVRQRVRSYRDLPLSFFQIQTKFRDEIRPRFGVMRSREFIMKDAYSFHTDADSLQQTYDDMFTAYNQIYQRIGFDFRSVAADSGTIGGNVSREFHVLADSGEDNLAIASQGDYAANVEMVSCPLPSNASPAEPSQPMNKVETPNCQTIDAVCNFLKTSPQQSIKVLVVHGSDSSKDDTKLVALYLRGDHRLNEIKAEQHPSIQSPLRMASVEELAQAGLKLGYIGPVDIPIQNICDNAASLLNDFVCGANEESYHNTGVNWQRDCQYNECADIRDICEGEPAPDGQGVIEIHRGIEVGHIFQLGDKYSTAMGASVKNQNNEDIAIQMGCYGIGVTRIIAAFIEQKHDDKGILWSPAIAPFHVHMLALRYDASAPVRETAEQLYQQLRGQDIQVLLDDRPLRAGILFSQADLFGMPFQLVISERNIEAGHVEIIDRTTGEKTTATPEQAIKHLVEHLRQ